ncbi:MAG: hypothetical protein V1725_05790 [archaeon]
MMKSLVSTFVLGAAACTFAQEPIHIPDKLQPQPLTQTQDYTVQSGNKLWNIAKDFIHIPEQNLPEACNVIVDAQKRYWTDKNWQRLNKDVRFVRNDSTFSGKDGIRGDILNIGNDSIPPDTLYFDKALRTKLALLGGNVSFAKGRDVALPLSIENYNIMISRINTLIDIAENHEQRITTLEDRMFALELNVVYLDVLTAFATLEQQTPEPPSTSLHAGGTIGITAGQWLQDDYALPVFPCNTRTTYSDWNAGPTVEGILALKDRAWTLYLHGNAALDWGKNGIIKDCKDNTLGSYTARHDAEQIRGGIGFKGFRTYGILGRDASAKPVDYLGVHGVHRTEKVTTTCRGLGVGQRIWFDQIKHASFVDAAAEYMRAQRKHTYEGQPITTDPTNPWFDPTSKQQLTTYRGQLGIGFTLGIPLHIAGSAAYSRLQHEQGFPEEGNVHEYVGSVNIMPVKPLIIGCTYGHTLTNFDAGPVHAEKNYWGKINISIGTDIDLYRMVGGRL